MSVNTRQKSFNRIRQELHHCAPI